MCGISLATNLQFLAQESCSSSHRKTTISCCELCVISLHGHMHSYLYDYWVNCKDSVLDLKILSDSLFMVQMLAIASIKVNIILYLATISYRCLLLTILQPTLAKYSIVENFLIWLQCC